MHERPALFRCLDRDGRFRDREEAFARALLTGTVFQVDPLQIAREPRSNCAKAGLLLESLARRGMAPLGEEEQRVLLLLEERVEVDVAAKSLEEKWGATMPFDPHRLGQRMTEISAAAQLVEQPSPGIY